MDTIRNKVRQTIREQKGMYEEISDYIFHHPELGGEEVLAAKYLTSVLAKNHFTVSFPFEKLPTAFVAEFGEEDAEPTIAYLAEYDALPGYGRDGGPGHACGHNWIAACMCGCGITLAKFARELNCRVKVIGTPAEETFGAKYDMSEAGCFDDVDVAMQAHLAEVTCLETKTLAMNSMEFTFRGKAAHAAQFPEKGINALDGVLQLFSGINALRQHVRSDARIHGIITSGGEVTNVVPDFAQCRFSFRAQDKAYLAVIREKILHIAEGAALMTGTGLTYCDYENPYDDIVNNPALVQAAKGNLEHAGVDGFLSKDEYLNPGSSDIGNVSHICPTLYFEVKPEDAQPCIVHDASALDLVNGEAAYKRMGQVIEGFVMTAAEIAQDSQLARQIADFHCSIS